MEIKINLIDKLKVILFQCLLQFKFNLIGSISLSEIYLIMKSPSMFNGNLKSFKSYNQIINLFFYLFIVQVISEIITSYSFSNSLKGFALTIMSLLLVIFYFRLLSSNIKYFFWLYVGHIISLILLKDKYNLYYGDINDAGFIKFYVVHVVNAILILLNFSKTQIIKNNLYILYILIGVLLIIYGSRSAASIIILTGIFFNVKIKRKQTLFYVFLFSLLVYIFYCLYVFYIIKYNISSGNNSQILELSNPYNIFELLLKGRFENYIASIAIMDKPLFGYGAWANDMLVNDGAYNKLMSQLMNNMYYPSDYKLIPCHSMILGQAVNNGIFASLLLCIICFKIIFLGIKVLEKTNKYKLIVIMFLLEILWDLLFSPLPHFRLLFPLKFAFILCLYNIFVNESNSFKYVKDIKSINNGKKDTCCYSNIGQ